uniref:receptor-like protein EIX1 n=1 Tax=Erigeron canadensis TaxID=72917 RepID=UPI001CB90B7D|nr:receptor-like protein EIX1 [Erigeron canadensis]
MKALKPLPFSSSLYCLWLFLFVSSLSTFCLCNHNSDPVLCIPTERLALIQLKNDLIDRSNRLSSWLGKDCCSWSGVVCDNSTGHVHEIHLRGPDDGISGHCHGSYDTENELLEASKQMLGGTISPALINLTQLRYLDLSCNDFNLTSIPSFIGSFKNLTYLNISSSQFGGDIPHHLGNLSTLRVLDLYSVSFFWDLHSSSLEWLRSLKSLEHLNMGRIGLVDASDWLEVISTLPSLLELHLPSCGLTQIHNNQTSVDFTSLTVLDLSDNLFDSLLPGWIFSLRSLDVLDLTGCYFHGLDTGIHGGFHSMPSLSSLRVSSNTFMNSSWLLKGLPSLTNLRFLDVSNCNISAPLLGSLKNLSLIVHLDLANNKMVEEIPTSLSNLCNLKHLDLQVGRLPEKLGRVKNLGSIDLSYNQLTGTIPDSLGSLSLLKTCQLMLNQLSGPIPYTIGDLSSLTFVDLSSNNLNASLPESVGRLGNLEFLALHHNSLEGVLTEKHFFNLTALKTLWIGDNKLVFKLNANWNPPFHLDVLRVGSCSLGLRFPSWIKTQTDLTELDLSSSNISDIIPDWNWLQLSSSVRYLNISHNNIQGKLGDVSFLTPGGVLDLSDNQILGVLPGFFNKPDLSFLDISNNSLSGSLNQFLCSGIQEPRQLSVLNLANNNMSGGIPDCWMNWESLVFLNLEKNKFSGIIPPSIGNLPSLLALDMRGNKLFGNLPVSLMNSKTLIIIELAENELNGRIPGSIGRDNTSLKLLSLSSNKLEGKIPNEICRLSSIQIMDLSHNDLSGDLPTCFTNFSVISGSEEISSPFLLYDSLFQNQVLGTASLVTKGRVPKFVTK